MSDYVGVLEIRFRQVRLLKLRCLETSVMNKRASPEVWSEDPSIMTFDTVVGNDGVATTATGDADEWPSRVRSVIFAAGGLFCASGVEDVREHRGLSGNRHKRRVTGRHLSSGVSDHGALKLKEDGIGSSD